VFKTVPEDFLRMITVHELAHLKERAHDKAFYSLCSHIEPRYHQLEFEVRVYLTHLEMSGKGVWGQPESPRLEAASR
jgi:predicted metal-dependent hydrolase